MKMNISDSIIYLVFLLNIFVATLKKQKKVKNLRFFRLINFSTRMPLKVRRKAHRWN